mmetsp:Transcript_68580/g.143025  ORF Transcript_68580/g.143025 Transcript_68580/m.143025 type:complete len:281 (-) Transcript_68580:610-1452(-)
MCERRQHLAVKLVLEVRPKVSLQLPHGVDRRPPHARVRVLKPASDLRDDLLEVLLHLLRTALGNLRNARQRSVPVLPVLVLEEGWHEVFAEGEAEDRLSSQRQCQSIQAVLAHVEGGQLGVVVVVVSGGVPLHHVHLLHHQHQLQRQRHNVLQEGRLLAHHGGRLLGQCDEQLNSEEARLFLQVLRRHDLDGHLDHRVHVLAEELGRLLRNRDELFDCRPCCLLVWLVQCRRQDAHHRRNHVREARDVLFELRERLHHARRRIECRQFDFLHRVLQCSPE